MDNFCKLNCLILAAYAYSYGQTCIQHAGNSCHKLCKIIVTMIAWLCDDNYITIKNVFCTKSRPLEMESICAACVHCQHWSVVDSSSTPCKICIQLTGWFIHVVNFGLRMCLLIIYAAVDSASWYFVYTMILHNGCVVAGVLRSHWSELPHQGNTLE